jgi:hypothetical protein
VAYGMRAEDLVFWLDRLPDVADSTGGVLCRRHADSMVVPRGWTLDDLRDPELHLFRPPTPLPPPARGQRPRAATRRGDRHTEPAIEQLELVAERPASSPIDGAAAASGEADPTDPGPWTPEFDEADDLDGLLSAHSPLLSRAFRTAGRSDR